jgi:hypothetical protein
MRIDHLRTDKEGPGIIRYYLIAAGFYTIIWYENMTFRIYVVLILYLQVCTPILAVFYHSNRP